VFDAIRSAMKSPLAKPPGKRGWVRRFAPEWCVLAVCLTMFLVFLRLFFAKYWSLETATLAGAVWAYVLAGLILLVGPLVSGALAWSRERDRDTLESLVLTPADRETVVRGRFWQGVFPWLRFCAYLLPIYLLLSTNGLFMDSHRHSEKWIVSDICAFGGHVFFGLFPSVWSECFSGMNPLHPWAVVLSLLRLLNEASIPLFVFALAYFLSLRCRTTGRAILWSCLLAPGALFTVFALHDWVLLLMIWQYLPFVSMEEVYAVICSAYLALGLAAFVARIWLALWLVKRAARNFDWYALGEKPPEAKPGPSQP
jgi:hypothetical protein